jgi:spermidine synthase
MEHSLRSEQDGSIALLIKGDLQFDSKDEYIYHEGLALPSLAIAAKRIKTPLKALVIGGGDGLVARELFKSSRVASLELVDYSQDVVNLAQNDFAAINKSSMSDSRMKLHVQDAWLFVDEALSRGESFDLIISDLTVAEDVAGARFHSIEWYTKLAQLLSAEGILSVNSVSPHATPDAFWSIFNGILKSGLQPRPYHVVIPSFAASGFGDDWGFLLASPKTIKKEELDVDLSSISPRNFLINNDVLRSLFLFPEKLFDVQPNSKPALDGSDILLHYFKHPSEISYQSATLRDAFTFGDEHIFVPEPDTGRNILPPDLGSALARTFSSIDDSNASQPGEIQSILHDAFVHIPALQQAETTELISDFFSEPIAFLRAIDLPALFARLLGRASELPSQMVSELSRLQESLQEWSGDEEAILGMGKRVTMILIVAIVIGNLLYPDMAYGKGYGGYGGNGWGNGGVSNYNTTRRTNVIKKGPYGPGPGASTDRQMRKMSLPQKNDVSNAEYIDEDGIAYPVRRYTALAENGKQMISAAYRLDSGVDILPNGHIAMPLTERAYLLVTPEETVVVSQRDGNISMRLHSDPSLVAMTIEQIDLQHERLSSSNSTNTTSSTQTAGSPNASSQNATPQPMLPSSTEAAVAVLSKSQDIYSAVSVSEVADLPLVDGGTEIFPSVWLTNDGQFVAIKREDGKIAYLDRGKWYSDLGKTELTEAYPESFRTVVQSQLTKMVREFSSTTKMLVANKDQVDAQHRLFARDLAAYEESSQPVVDFGSHQIPRVEAIRLMQGKLQKAQLQIQELNSSIGDTPVSIKLAQLALENLSSDRRV